MTTRVVQLLFRSLFEAEIFLNSDVPFTNSRRSACFSGNCFWAALVEPVQTLNTFTNEYRPDYTAADSQTEAATLLNNTYFV